MTQAGHFTSNRRALRRSPVIIESLVAVLMIASSFLLSSSSSQANPAALEEKQATVVRAKSRITVDGLLNEPDWLETQPVGEILQRDPRPGEKATEKTELKLVYDVENLYIGVTCYDSEPNRIIGTQMEDRKSVV